MTMLSIGSINIWPGENSTIPNNFLLCDGRSLNRSDYSELFNIIGTTYGIGNGSDTFNLPNLQDRVAIGSSNNKPLASESGDPNIKVSPDNIPLISMNQPTGSNTPVVF